MAAAARLLTALALVLGCGALALQVLLPGPAIPALEAAGALPAPQPQAGDPAAFGRRLSAALAAPAFPDGTADAFPPPGTAETPAPAAGGRALFAPLEFRAEPEAAGIRLTWKPHPGNPVEGLRYRLTRWMGDGEAEELALVAGLEYLDHGPCEGVSYRYRLRATTEREILQGRPVLRESPAAAASVELPRSTRWEALGRAGEDKLVLRAERPGRPPLGPAMAGPGEELGATGWFVEEVGFRETEVAVETRSPRFDALGRRVIIAGRPADRVREANSRRLLAMVRLSDPCGSSWRLELLLPGDLAEEER